MSLQLTNVEAKKLLLDCGFRKVEWNNEKMALKLLSITDVIEKGAELDDQASDLLLKDVLAEIAGDGDILVVDADAGAAEPADESDKPVSDPAPEAAPTEEETADTPQADSKTEAAAKKKQEKEAAAAKKKADKEAAAAKKKQDRADAAANAKPSVAKDAFGFRVGSAASELAACLTTTPQAMKELVAASKGKGTQYQPLNELAAAGKINKTGDRKYSLK